MSVAAPKVVGYLTDVEGNWEYFQNCLAFSSVLQVFAAERTLCCPARVHLLHSDARTVE